MPSWRELKRFCERDGWELYKVTDHYFYRKDDDDGNPRFTKVSKGSGEIYGNLWNTILKKQLRVTKEYFRIHGVKVFCLIPAQRGMTIMFMQKELPIRKNIRLKEYDYSSVGYYFITICVKDKHEMLGSIDVGTNCVRPNLSEYGHIAEKEIAVLASTYDMIDVNKYIIMPNHIHMIIMIESDNSGRTQFVPDCQKSSPMASFFDIM